MLRRVILAAIVRDPLEVATSLYLRNAMPIERGLAIWFLYNHHLAFHLQTGDQIFDYAQLLRGEYLEGYINSPINSINSLLEHIAQPVLQKSNIETIFRRRISKDLNRSATGLPAMPAAELPGSRLLPICEEAISHWRASEDQISGWREAFGSIPLALSQVLSDKNWHSNLCPKSEELRLINELSKKQDEIMALKLERQQNIETLQKILENINNSTSWKITNPLRWCANRLKN